MKDNIPIQLNKKQCNMQGKINLFSLQQKLPATYLLITVGPSRVASKNAIFRKSRSVEKLVVLLVTITFQLTQKY